MVLTCQLNNKIAKTNIHITLVCLTAKTGSISSSCILAIQLQFQVYSHAEHFETGISSMAMSIDGPMLK